MRTWHPALALTLTIAVVSMGAVTAVIAAPGLAAAQPSWSSPLDVDGSNFISSVSCASVSFCVAVDLHGNALTFNGTIWSAPVNVELSGFSNGPNAVSCTSSTFCMATDRLGQAIMFNGSKWSGLRHTREQNAVSCASTTFCMNVGDKINNHGIIAQYGSFNGKRWSAPRRASRHFANLGAISCPTSGFCMAVGSQVSCSLFGCQLLDNFADTLSARRSSVETFPGTDAGKGGFDAVSCVSSSLCVVLANWQSTYGDAITYDSGTWSSAQTIDSGAGMNAVSCSPGTTSCMAVGGSDAISFSAGGWSAPVSINPGGDLTSISCPTSSFCAAVDRTGHVLSYSGT
jgi:hypothetical protein